MNTKKIQDSQPDQILEAVTNAVDSILLEVGQTPLAFTMNWGARPNPALDGQRPDALWDDDSRMPALTHLAKLAVLARASANHHAPYVRDEILSDLRCNCPIAQQLHEQYGLNRAAGVR